MDAPSAAKVTPPPRRKNLHPSKRSKKVVARSYFKLFVLDTNVLLHDPMSLFRFEEHDIFLPMIVLEELDGHKRA